MRRLLCTVLAFAAALVAAIAGPAAAAGVRVGEEDGRLWLVVPAPESAGFRLDAAAPGCRLVFPAGIPGAPMEVRAALPGLEALRVEAAGEGKEAAIRLPFPPSALLSVGRDAEGWRFEFATARPSSVEKESDVWLDAGEYRLGVRDAIDISVFGHEDLSGVSSVPPDGVLNFPLIGAIQVEGRTVTEVEQELTRRLGEDFLVDPQVTVRVKDYESQWVNVVGQVRNPGKYALKGRARLIDVITQAGGMTDKAGSEIVVSRQDPQAAGGLRQFKVAREDLFSPDNRGTNIFMRHEDVVNVSEQEVFYIQGEVARPGSYALERGYTVLKAISIAGGFSQWADRKEVELLRDENGEQRKLILNLKAIAERKKPDVDLRAEDIIIVKRRVL